MWILGVNLRPQVTGYFLTCPYLDLILETTGLWGQAPATFISLKVLHSNLKSLATFSHALIWILYLRPLSYEGRPPLFQFPRKFILSMYEMNISCESEEETSDLKSLATTSSHALIWIQYFRPLGYEGRPLKFLMSKCEMNISCESEEETSDLKSLATTSSHALIWIPYFRPLGYGGRPFKFLMSKSEMNISCGPAPVCHN